MITFLSFYYDIYGEKDKVSKTFCTFLLRMLISIKLKGIIGLKTLISLLHFMVDNFAYNV